MMGPACSGVIPVAITAQDKIDIVKVHNDYRRFVASGQETRGATGAQPSAADMREMVSI